MFELAVQFCIAVGRAHLSFRRTVTFCQVLCASQPLLCYLSPALEVFTPVFLSIWLMSLLRIVRAEQCSI
jgi:hypothetical protein